MNKRKTDMADYYLGIDNGGTFIKAAIYDGHGKPAAVASGQTPLLTGEPRHTERDMEALWEENIRTVRKTVKKAEINPGDIRGVSFSGHGKGLYLWGKDERPAYHGISSTDGRAWEYPVRWEQNGTAARLFGKTCQKPLACQPVALLKWFQEHAPEVLERTKWIFGVKDYIRFRMTGEAYAELTDFSGSNLVNLHTGTYDREILELLGLDEVWEKLPPLRRSYDRCGALNREAAEQMGLSPGIPCAAGLFDIDACAIAMNVTDGENMAVIAGTWGINEYISHTPVLDGSVMMNSLYCLPGYYLIEESSPTSAANHEWYVNTFMAAEKAQCAGTGDHVYALTDRMAESVAPGAQGILFLPYLFGSNYDARAKAAFIGMDNRHTAAHMVRAVFEGIAFCHMVHLEKLLAGREKPRCVCLAGGICNSRVWVQIFADVFDLPVKSVRAGELGTLGAAMTAAVAAGRYDSLEKAAEGMASMGETVLPIPENVTVYREKYRLYRQVSAALEPLWKNF